MGFPSQLAALANEFIGDKRKLSGSGYQKLPGGLIIQWGMLSVNGAGPSSATLPIAFPNTVFRVFANHLNGGGGGGLAVAIAMQSSSSISLSTSATAGTHTVGWLAIGH